MRLLQGCTRTRWMMALLMAWLLASCDPEASPTTTPIPDDPTPTAIEATADNPTQTEEVPAEDPTPTVEDAANPTPTAEDVAIDRGDCAGDVMPIGAIQGAEMASSMVGDTVTIEGLVVGDGEADDLSSTTDIRGFYVQDRGDGDPTTSDGLFVFTNIDEHADEGLVTVGDYVQVTGRISEFPTNNDDSSQTQISLFDAAENLVVCSSGNPLPAPIAILLPFESATHPERYESMYVTFPQELSVTELFQLGRHGQLSLSSGGRLQQPTHLAAPGADSIALIEANALNQIVLDDFNLTQNPDPIIFPAPELSADNTVRGGDTITGITGILTHSRARTFINPETTVAYRLRVSDPVAFERANPRPTTLPDLGDAELTVVSFNVLNFFNGDGQGGGYPTERGADNAAEFERQLAKTVNALVALDADIFGLIELENDSGANQAIAALVSAFNDVLGEETYAFVDTGRIGGDAIRVGFVYRTTAVTPVGDFAVLDGIDPFNRNTRPPLAQLWEDNASGEQFYAIVNHFKSKSTSGCPPTGSNADAGEGQGCWNEDRVLAATEVLNWINTDPYFEDDADVLIIGDLNAYAMEDPITTLIDAGYTNLIAQFGDAQTYSFVFDGQWGYLDHALANAALLPQIAGVAEFHINADEPSVLDYNTEFKSDNHVESLYREDFYRVSDHDPLLIGLRLGG